MAILRGGRRIGNFDIRLGLPRDKSLIDVAGDPRLKRKPGGNPKTTINTFIANINEGEGIARPTRFLVRFSLPGTRFTSRAPEHITGCLLYTSPSPRDRTRSRMPSSA